MPIRLKPLHACLPALAQRDPHADPGSNRRRRRWHLLASLSIAPAFAFLSMGSASALDNDGNPSCGDLGPGATVRGTFNLPRGNGRGGIINRIYPAYYIVTPPSVEIARPPESNYSWRQLSYICDRIWIGKEFRVHVWIDEISILAPPAESEDVSCKVGNTCAVASGTKVQEETDYAAPDLPSALTLRRTYRSSYRAPQLGTLGPGWMHEWQRRLDLTQYHAKTPALTWVRGNGTTVAFAFDDGKWTATDGSGATVTAVAGVGGAKDRFRLADRHGTRTEDYDTLGNLVHVKDGSAWVALSYSDRDTSKDVAPHAALLTEIRNDAGQSMRFSYSWSGLLKEVLLPDGMTLKYGYSTKRMLTSVTFPDGAERKYHYEIFELPWALTGITDEKNTRFATYDYDANGRVISTEHAGGVDKFQLDFPASGRTSVTTADGRTRTFISERQGRAMRITGVTAACPACGPLVKAVTYESTGRVGSKVDFSGNETHYSYDGLGRETRRIAQYGTAQAMTTTTEWHPAFGVPVKIAEPGRFSSYRYDRLGRPVGHARYATGDIAGGMGTAVTPAGPVTSTEWTYGTDGQRSVTTVHVDGVLTGRWTYTYDEKGRLQTITDMAGRVARATRYDAAGRLVEGVSLDGEKLGYEFDARGRMARFTVDGRALAYEYDPAGFLTDVRGPNDYHLRYTYDAAHRLTSIAEPPMPERPVDTSNPFRGPVPVAGSGSAAGSDATAGSEPTATPWQTMWLRFVRWIFSWITPARATASVPRAIPAWPSQSQAPSHAQSIEDELMGRTENPNAMLGALDRSLRALAARGADAASCEEEPRCTEARREAQTAHHTLTTRRLPQYLGGMKDAGHRQAIVQTQNQLQRAIREIRQYCIASPLELPEWERAANQEVPILH